MNTRKNILAKNRLMRLVIHRSRYGDKQGCVKVYPNNSKEHEVVKLLVAHKLMNLGYDVYTETEFTNGKRADVIAIQNGVGYAVEVLHTESEARYLAKLASYPEEFTLVKVRTKDFDYDTFCL